ncbi:MAG: hypothetical protein J6D42_11730 [Clostridia bacterium]|nr:hypothetical protein [Clostridia bacterium]
MNSVENFINKFNSAGKTQSITEVFTCGYCYWFAHILHSRFPKSEIMYDPVVNHFVVKYQNRLYDITGDVTEKYDVIPWKDFSGSIERKRIIDHCIEFNK